MKLFLTGPLIFLAGALLASCQTASPDPAAGGFISGVSGVMGGGYQQRIDEKEQVLQSEQSEHNALMDRAAALRKERAQIRYELDRSQARISKLHDKIAEQKRKLNTEQGRNTDAWLQLRKAEKKISQVDRSYKVASADSDNLPVPEAKARVGSLQDDLDELDGLVSVVDELSAGY